MVGGSTEVWDSVGACAELCALHYSCTRGKIVEGRGLCWVGMRGDGVTGAGGLRALLLLPACVLCGREEKMRFSRSMVAEKDKRRYTILGLHSSIQHSPSVRHSHLKLSLTPALVWCRNLGALPSTDREAAD